VSGLRVSRCVRCRRVVFPRRELCPHCGNDAFMEDSVDGGTATEVTSHRGTSIASVEVEGTRLLARAGFGVEPGSPVTLAADDGAPVASSP
jgi:uncharacterized OB-fold protein